MAKWPWDLPKRSNSGYSKQLEGIEYTPTLKKLVQQTVDQGVAGVSGKDSFYSMDPQEALTTVTDFAKQPKPIALPLDVLRAMYSLLPSSSALESALLSSRRLVYTPPPDPNLETPQQRRWRKRMDRLRLRAEEQRYHNLTQNLEHEVADDITTKSMTYAASVGLNMIIAPISFGVFMYFFAGGIFTFILGSEGENPAKEDIRRVIAGVVSGVGMLFIEMILFVIRTHSMDKSLAKKAKKKKLSPFGYTKPEQLATGVATGNTTAPTSST